jgi:HPt (histidine-containing phosphotransfer) domain-containing protein
MSVTVLAPRNAALGSALNTVLQACNFKIVQCPDSALWRLEPNSAPVPDKVPAPDSVSASRAISAFVLPDPARITDVVVALLALDVCPVTEIELNGLFDRLYDLAGQDRVIATELADSLLMTNEGDLKALRAALAAARWEDMVSMAHRLKSSASMVSCLGLVEICASLETLGKAHQSDDSADEIAACALLALMSSAFGRLHARLQKILAV